MIVETFSISGADGAFPSHFRYETYALERAICLLQIIPDRNGQVPTHPGGDARMSPTAWCADSCIGSFREHVSYMSKMGLAPETNDFPFREQYAETHSID